MSTFSLNEYLIGLDWITPSKKIRGPVVAEKLPDLPHHLKIFSS